MICFMWKGGENISIFAKLYKKIENLYFSRHHVLVNVVLHPIEVFIACYFPALVVLHRSKNGKNTQLLQACIGIPQQ